MLWNQLQRLGIEVVCNKRAVEYFEIGSHGGVVTSDGERTEADIVIAADGIGSKAQTLIMGEQVRGMYSGHSVFRTAYPIEIAFQDPIVRENFHLIDGRPILRAFYG
jgi:2-polyprenyl-6-methoxyphenol hydroxylase-like FAD-dependent oxidoreductase